jgi:hypothetical protein
MATSGILFVSGKGTAANLDLPSLADIYLHELIREVAGHRPNLVSIFSPNSYSNGKCLKYATKDRSGNWPGASQELAKM